MEQEGLTGAGSAPATPVRITLLGRFAIEKDGQPLRFGGRSPHKPLELLKALVALGGDSVPAETLGDALWPEAEGDQANHSLHTTLARLRRLIGADALTFQNGRLTLEPSQCWVDALACARQLEQAERYLAEAKLDQALAALGSVLEQYRGPFLEGEFAPPPVLPARERLHGTLLRVVEKAASALSQQKRHQEAITLYRRALERDDQAESLYQGVLREALATGRTAEGLAAYQRCRDVLEHALSTTPSAETERLRQDLSEAGAAPGKGFSFPDAARPGEAGAVEPPKKSFLQRRRFLLGAGGALLLAVVAASGAWMAFRNGAHDPTGAPGLAVPPNSVAVLPFENLSGDPEQEYFSDAISDNLITELSRNKLLFVTARNSSFSFKGGAVDVKRVGRELGVRHVLEGSVQRSGGRVRIQVQLIDAATGKHLRAERYDRKLSDVFGIQDDIAGKVFNIVVGGVLETAGESPLRPSAKTSPNFKANDLAWRAAFFHRKAAFEAHPELFSKAIQLAEEALELEPALPQALFVKGLANIGLGWRGQGLSYFKTAFKTSRRMLEVAPSDSRAHLMSAMVTAMLGRTREASASYERAVELNPNFSLQWILGGFHFALVEGDPKKGLRFVERGVRLDPFYSPGFSYQIGAVYYFNGLYERALAELQKKTLPRYPQWLRVLAATQVKLGKLDEAKETARDFLRLKPGFSLKNWRKENHMHPTLWTDYSATLHQAGLPR